MRPMRIVYQNLRYLLGPALVLLDSLRLKIIANKSLYFTYLGIFSLARDLLLPEISLASK
jgi:hypothetical protein